MNSDDRKIVIVAYFFPPLGLAGTHRPLAWANYLAKAGHKVTVLTVKPIAYPVYDQSQLEQLDSRVEVVRVGSTDPARVAKFLPFLARQGVQATAKDSAARRLLFPDSKIGFVRPAWRKLKKLLAGDRNTILVTTSPPVSSHLLGLRAKSEGGCKWLADWRDIWGSEPAAGDDKFRACAVSLTEDILAGADRLTATSPMTVDYWQELTESDKYSFLPNGYDESDFTPPRQTRASSIGIYGTINHLTGIVRILAWLRAFRQQGKFGDFEIRHTGQMQVRESSSRTTPSRDRSSGTTRSATGKPAALISLAQDMSSVTTASTSSRTASTPSTSGRPGTSTSTATK